MIIRFILLFIFSLSSVICNAQDLKLSLDRAIQSAQQSSFDAFRSKNIFLIKQLQHKDFQYSKLPRVNFSLNPGNYSRSNQEQWNYSSENYEFVEINRLTSSGKLSLSQDIGLTGGRLSLYSNIYRNQAFGSNSSINYNIQAISISYSQSIGKINTIKWRNKIHPLVFEEAKNNFAEEKENLAIKTTNVFFELLSAQVNLKVARINKNIADSLYQIGLTKVTLGSITGYDLSGLELKRINAKVELQKNLLLEKEACYNLCDLLKLPRSIKIECIIPDELNSILINYEQAKELAFSNNPDIYAFKRKILELNKSVKQAKSSKIDIRFSANIGYNKSSREIVDAYQNMDEMQTLSISANIPILNWGEQKRRVQIAEINKEIAVNEMENVFKEIDMEILKLVDEYNLQQGIINASYRANNISRRSYEIMVKRFALGKVSIVQINEAYRDMQYAQNNYINALKTYWVYYFTLRKICLFDFEKKENLSYSIE